MKKVTITLTIALTLLISVLAIRHQSFASTDDWVYIKPPNFHVSGSSSQELLNIRLPIIFGVQDIDTTVNHSISYLSNVYAYDGYGKRINVEVDNSDVDISTAGVYEVNYKATDENGLFSTKKATVYVSEENCIDMHELEKCVQLVLSNIISDDMTEDEKCWSVYNYLHSIPYVDTVYSEDWMTNGYYMLTMRCGDCFGYYSASRLLLEALGYDVMQVVNNNGFNHTWCLVSRDGGKSWYHFDPTCWKWINDIELCMVNDETLSYYGWNHAVSYSQASHDWDRTLYPASN